mmetsp:Transcript_126538/g.188840  ORF Transcript_126538/g.188840 Transcript_126538/m.188840 type:complete len:693 (+) Transcript_126538:110-2188(+)
MEKSEYPDEKRAAKAELSLASATGEVERNSTMAAGSAGSAGSAVFATATAAGRKGNLVANRDEAAKEEARKPSSLTAVKPGAYSVSSNTPSASAKTGESSSSSASASRSRPQGLQLASAYASSEFQTSASQNENQKQGQPPSAAKAHSITSCAPRLIAAGSTDTDDLKAGSVRIPREHVGDIELGPGAGPGSHAVSAEGHEKSQEYSVHMSKSPSGISSLPTLEAVKVESQSDLAVATAEKDSCWAFFKRSRCAQLGTFFGCFLIVALAIGLSLAFFNKSIQVEEEPPIQFFDQVGPHLDGPVIRAQHGSSISLNTDGTRMAVADSRDVYLYDLEEDVDGTLAWLLVATIEAPENATLGITTNVHDMVRTSVQVDLSNDGNFIAVGWPYSANEEGLEPSIGRVEVYQNQGLGTWARLGNVMYGWSSSDFFGSSVSLSGSGGTVAVGAPGNNGHADIFLLNQGEWVKQGGIVSLEGSLLVGSVSIDESGQTFAVGGNPVSREKDSSLAVVRIFGFLAGDWAELGDGIIGDFQDTAYLAALSADGTIVAVSNYYRGEAGPSEGDLNDALDVRAFKWNGKEWIQLGGNLHALAPGEKSGYFITLSDDGTLMGMGDPGRANIEGGGVAGHAHIYQYDESSQLWEQRGPNKDGQAPGDQFGFAVALSGDGKRFATGAPFNRGEGVERGRVSVFAIDL